MGIFEEALQIFYFFVSGPQLLILFTQFKAKDFLELGANEVFVLKEPSVNLNKLVHLSDREFMSEITGKV